MMPYNGLGYGAGGCCGMGGGGNAAGGRMYGGNDIIGVQNMYGEQMAGGFTPAAIGAYGPNDVPQGSSNPYMDYGGTLPHTGGPGPSYGNEFAGNSGPYSGYGGMGVPSAPQGFEYPPTFGGATIGAPETCGGTETAFPGYNGYSQDDINRLTGGIPNYDFEQHKRPPPMPGQKSIPQYYLHYGILFKIFKKL